MKDDVIADAKYKRLLPFLSLERYKYTKVIIFFLQLSETFLNFVCVVTELNQISSMKRLTSLLLLSTILFGCGVNEVEHLKVVAQRDSLQLIVNSLTERVDVLENGEERLMNFITLHNNKKNYIKAAENIEALKKHHPESQLMRKHSKLFSEIESKAQVLKDSIDKAVRDSIKLASITELGDWKIGNFVNDFDEPTGEHFVIAEFYGVFSNSATAGSRLRIRAVVTSYSDEPSINLKYDEYNNGTYEDERVTYCRVVNKEKRKSYYDDHGWGVYTDKETRERFYLYEMLKNEGVYEFEMNLKYGTKYQFTIDSRYLNNALVKAKLISLDEFLAAN